MWLASVAWRDRRSTRGHHAFALLQRPLLDLERHGLVVAEPVHLGHLGAAVAVLALDDAGVGDLPTARGVERRLDELGQHPAVLALDAPTVVCCSTVS